MDRLQLKHEHMFEQMLNERAFMHGRRWTQENPLAPRDMSKEDVRTLGARSAVWNA